jgi:3-oxoacyl-[acyl-carrier protein] reductase
MEKRLSNKVALVTGSGRGIGKAIAESMASQGARVVVTARTESQVQETADAIRASGGEALALPGDLREKGAVEAMIDAAVDQWGRIDILVNNAAWFPGRVPFLDSDEQRWRDIVDTNLISVMRITQLVARRMVADKVHGRIVNISSINGIRYRVGTDGQTEYNACKAALDNLTCGWAMELAPHGIAVLGVAPGFIVTRSLDSDPVEEESFIKAYLEDGRIPQRRLGKPEDCARLVCFLASDDCSYVTGETIYQDGGMHFIF